MVEVSSIGGLILLALDVWAVIKTLESGTSTGNKVLWTLLIVLLPVIGLILWFLFGPRKPA